MTPTKRWLQKARATDDPAGDLVADMRRDTNIPRLFANIGQMRSYLVAHGACPEALAAIPIVWRRYSAYLNRRPFGPLV